MSKYIVGVGGSKHQTYMCFGHNFLSSCDIFDILQIVYIFHLEPYYLKHSTKQKHINMWYINAQKVAFNPERRIKSLLQRWVVVKLILVRSYITYVSF